MDLTVNDIGNKQQIVFSNPEFPNYNLYVGGVPEGQVHDNMAERLKGVELYKEPNFY